MKYSEELKIKVLKLSLENLSNKIKKIAHYIKTTWNMDNIPSGIFIVDHARNYA